MRRDYPESGPERREREEAYGQGTYELKACRKCDAPFTKKEREMNFHIMQRDVSGGYRGPYTGADGVPLRINNSGGLCSKCR